MRDYCYCYYKPPLWREKSYVHSLCRGVNNQPVSKLGVSSSDFFILGLKEPLHRVDPSHQFDLLENPCESWEGVANTWTRESFGTPLDGLEKVNTTFNSSFQLPILKRLLLPNNRRSHHYVREGYQSLYKVCK